jgi:hypothetical protein
VAGFSRGTSSGERVTCGRLWGLLFERKAIEYRRLRSLLPAPEGDFSTGHPQPSRRHVDSRRPSGTVVKTRSGAGLERGDRPRVTRGQRGSASRPEATRRLRACSSRGGRRDSPLAVQGSKLGGQSATSDSLLHFEIAEAGGRAAAEDRCSKGLVGIAPVRLSEEVARKGSGVQERSSALESRSSWADGNRLEAERRGPVDIVRTPSVWTHTARCFASEPVRTEAGPRRRFSKRQSG